MRTHTFMLPSQPTRSQEGQQIVIVIRALCRPAQQLPIPVKPQAKLLQLQVLQDVVVTVCWRQGGKQATGHGLLCWGQCCI